MFRRQPDFRRPQQFGRSVYLFMGLIIMHTDNLPGKSFLFWQAFIPNQTVTPYIAYRYPKRVSSQLNTIRASGEVIKNKFTIDDQGLCRVPIDKQGIEIDINFSVTRSVIFSGLLNLFFLESPHILHLLPVQC